MDDEIFISDDEDEDNDNDSKFHLLHIFNDTRLIFEYCIKLRKEYRKALKQFNNLNEEDTRSVIKSYAKLEVIVKDDQFGIENDNKNSNNNNESNDDFWDFVYELRDKVEEDSKMLNNYVEVEKEIILSKKDIEEDVPPTELNDIVENVLNVKNEFHKLIYISNIYWYIYTYFHQFIPISTYFKHIYAYFYTKVWYFCKIYIKYHSVVLLPQKCGTFVKYI